MTWSGIRSKLEKECLAKNLRGRIRFFCTSDPVIETECVEVYFDGKAFFRTTQNKYWDKWWENKNKYADKMKIDELYRFIDKESAYSGCFLIRHFREAAMNYMNQPIENSLDSESPLVRMFAVLDRRVGKRRLPQLAEKMNGEPEWLKQFYLIRLSAEGISV